MSEPYDREEAKRLRKERRAKERERKRKILLIVSLIVVILAVLIVVVLIVLFRGHMQAEEATVAATSELQFDIEYAGEETVFSSSTEESDTTTTSTSDSQTTTSELPTIDLTGINSTNAYMERLSDGAVCADQGGEDQIYPASMTKIMTTILAIENIDDLSQTYTFDGSEFDTGYANGLTTVGYQSGDTATYTDILYGIMLPSGADCCYAIANAVAGDESSFVDMMNQKAQELGMSGTHFSNCTGAQAEDHYTTCADIALLLKYALDNDTFRVIFTTSVYTTEPTTDNPSGITMSSTMFMALTTSTLDNGTTIEGGKTGFTDEAGHCLASLAMAQDGTEYILVTAGAAGSADDTPHIDDAITIYSQLPGTAAVTNDEEDVELDFGETIISGSDDSQ